MHPRTLGFGKFIIHTKIQCYQIESIFIVIIEVLEGEYLLRSIALSHESLFQHLQFQIQMGYIEALVHYVHVGVYSFPKIYSTTIDDKSSDTFSVPLKFFSGIQNRFNIKVRYIIFKMRNSSGLEMSLWPKCMMELLVREQNYHNKFAFLFGWQKHSIFIILSSVYFVRKTKNFDRIVHIKIEFCHPFGDIGLFEDNNSKSVGL